MDTNTREVMFSSRSDEYETPRNLYERLDKIFNFTLDPCASDLSHMSENYYTLANNGLSKDWDGEVCYVNPPYSDVSDWLDKCALEHLNNATEIVALIPARTETKYWHSDIWGIARYVLFLKGRLKFINRTLPPFATGGKPSSAPYPSAVIFYTYRTLDKEQLESLTSIGAVIDLREGLI